MQQKHTDSVDVSLKAVEQSVQKETEVGRIADVKVVDRREVLSGEVGVRELQRHIARQLETPTPLTTPLERVKQVRVGANRGTTWSAWDFEFDPGRVEGSRKASEQVSGQSVSIEECVADLINELFTMLVWGGEEAWSPDKKADSPATYRPEVRVGMSKSGVLFGRFLFYDD